MLSVVLRGITEWIGSGGNQDKTNRNGFEIISAARMQLPRSQASLAFSTLPKYECEMRIKNELLETSKDIFQY